MNTTTHISTTTTVEEVLEGFASGSVVVEFDADCGQVFLFLSTDCFANFEACVEVEDERGDVFFRTVAFCGPESGVECEVAGLLADPSTLLPRGCRFASLLSGCASR